MSILDFLKINKEKEKKQINSIFDLPDDKLANAIEARWNDSDTLWQTIKSVTDKNKKYYNNEPDYLSKLPKSRSKVRASRIFVNTEAVINSLIANPPQINIVPGRETPESKDLASAQEKYFKQKYKDRNIKEKLRKGLRNLYFSRIVVFKPFWNTQINDFDLAVLDPTKVRIYKNATKEEEAPFIIEEVSSSVLDMVKRFPVKKDRILKAAGVENEEDLYVNPIEDKYKEAWIDDYIVYKYNGIILDKEKNPYYDWDGIPLSREAQDLLDTATTQAQVKEAISSIRANEIPDEANIVARYKYNYFNFPRKPYIFATVFNHEQSPVGSTDLITQAIPVQDDVDETKRNITENARIVNGVIKVDSQVMTQSEAAKLRFDPAGIIYGKNVKDGVTRETGAPLPNFVIENLNDSRNQIDDIMASSSAFRGVREGQETKGGRLALIDQSFLRLNEFVQVVDYLNNEIFSWFFQLGKLFYTENHYAKFVGPNQATEIIQLTRDDMENGSQVKVLAGKSLPEDRQFKYEQAQEDFKNGLLSPNDYFDIAGYDNPNALAKNKVIYDLNAPVAVGIDEEQMTSLVPPKQPEEQAPKITIPYELMPLDAKLQALEKAGIHADPRIMEAEAVTQHTHESNAKQANTLKVLADAHAIMRNGNPNQMENGDNEKEDETEIIDNPTEDITESGTDSMESP